MKTFAKRFPGEMPSRGFLAPCGNCGEQVVHAESTGMPMHMHRYSEKCKKGGEALRAAARRSAEAGDAPRSK